MLKIATSAPTGVVVDTGRLDASGIGAQHPDRLAAAERSALGLGDPDDGPLPRQRQPDEDHPAVEPGDAVPTVGHRTDVDLDLDARGELVTGQRNTGYGGFGHVRLLGLLVR